MANRFFINVGTSWNSTANWSTSSGGGGGASIPTILDAVFFDANSGSCNIDVNANCLSLDSTGYANTITQDSTKTLTVASGTFLWAAGTFAGGDADIYFGGDFSQTGGTFTATSATCYVTGNAAISGGSFAHNNGLFLFDNTADKTFNPGGKTFWSVQVNCPGFVRALTGNLTGGGNVTVTDGILRLSGYNLVFAAGTFTLTNTLYLDGTETISYSSLVNATGTVVYENTGATAVLNNFGTQFYHLTFLRGKTHNVTASSTINITGTLAASGTGLATLRSTSPATQYAFNCSSPQSLAAVMDVQDCNAISGSAIAAYGSTNSGNNKNWNFIASSARYFVGAVDADWNDTGNWSLAGGGAGGAGVPSGNMYAVFDNNSPNCTVDVGFAVSVYSVILGAYFTNTLDINDNTYATSYNGGTVVAGGTLLCGTGAVTFGTSGGLTVSGGVVNMESATISTYTFAQTGGTVTATSGTWTSSSNWQSSGGTFNNGSGLLVMTTNSTLQLAVGSLYNLTFAGGSAVFAISGTVAVANDLTLTSAQRFDTGTLAVTGNIVTTLASITAGTVTINWVGGGTKTLSASGGSGYMLALNVNGAGTLNINDTILTKSSWTYTAGTVGGTGTVDFNNTAASQTITGAFPFYNLAITKGTGADLTVTTAVTVANNLTINSVRNIITGTISVTGNILTTATAVAGSGTIIWVGGGTKTLSASGGTGAVGNFTVNGAGTLNINDTIRFNGTWTHTAGTIGGAGTVVSNDGTSNATSGSVVFPNFQIACGGYNTTIGTTVTCGNLTITSAANLNGGTITATGNITTTRTVTTGTCAITWTGAGSSNLSTTVTGRLPAGTFTVNGSGTLTLSSGLLNLAGTGQDLVVNGGTFNLATYALTVDDTITVSGGTLLMGTAAFSHSGGTITVSGGTWNHQGASITSAALVTMSSGTLTATSGTWTQNHNLTFSGGTFNHSSGTIVFSRGGDHTTINVGAATFWNVTVNQTYYLYVTGAFDVNGTLLLTKYNQLVSGTINAGGNVRVTDSAVTTSGGTLNFDGAGPQTLDANGGTGVLPRVTINKGGDTLSISDTINIINGLAWTAGAVSCGTSTINFVNYGNHTTCIPGNIQFNNVGINMVYNFAITGTLDINGNCVITSVGDLTGAITVAKNLTLIDTSMAGSTATMTLDGTGTQLIDTNGGTGRCTTGTLNISNTGLGIAKLSNGALTLAAGQNMNVNADGAFCSNGYNCTVPGTLTINPTGVFTKTGAETITYGALSGVITAWGTCLGNPGVTSGMPIYYN